MILWLLLMVLVLWTALFRFRRRRLYALAAKFPRPKDELPIIGIAHKLSGNTEAETNITDRYRAAAVSVRGSALQQAHTCCNADPRTDTADYGKALYDLLTFMIPDILASLRRYSYEAMDTNGITRGWLNHILYFLVLNPVDLEMILKTCLEKDDLHRFIRKVIGYGGIFAPVSIWRRRRKILLPAFSPKIVESFVEVFSEQSEVTAQRLSGMRGSAPFNIWPFICAYSLDSVCETAMDVKVNAQTNSNSPFLRSLALILNIVCERIFHLWLQPDWLFKLFPQYPKHQHCIKTLHDFTDEVIQKKRDEIRNQKQSQPEADVQYDFSNYQRKSFLDLLISLSGGQNGYTDLELREEILTLTVAGTDTSTVAICFTLILLGKYPHIQKKLYEEIQDVFGDSKRPLVKEDLTKLKYLERVIKESLRLYPPVPFIIRKVENEITLPSGLTLPAGSGVAVSIYGCHRDPKYWGPDAEHFDPDRFLPERFNLKHACSYMPFSNGPRNCVGYQYAMMSIKTALTSILRNYKIIGEPETGPIPRIRIKLDIMMKAAEGYQVTLEKRKSCPLSDSQNS